ncbi:hypothetical protein LX16_4013 [Stackebrandtia albiflava]|uniref:Lumazine-binding protein n=1 Tax=Stackebrandtia albiflava TaxID=406432 RepID=A0A562UY74_9ACTN|nr:hypothetical protein [Stackebrandtia albiflava]TWJ10594.1 hypothetical protein LX16_4013 [Stackebrandtia albiflava]
MPLPEDTTTVEPEEPSSPPRGTLIAAALLSAVAVFVAAVVLGVMWLAGAWEGTGRESPVESVDGFLTALLVDRDPQAAASYTCKSLTGDLTEALRLLESLPEAGTPEAAATGFTWTTPDEISNTDDTAIVTADVTLELTGESERWSFAVVTGDPDQTWRVCGVVTEPVE